MLETTETTAITVIEAEVATWEKSLIAELQAMADMAKPVTVAGHTGGEREGAKAVRECRLGLRRVRLDIQSKAKEFADVGRQITKTAKSAEAYLVGIIEPEEKRLDREECAYEETQARIKREAEELQKQITAQRWAQMQALEVTPLDYKLCETATDSMWEEYVEVWERDKRRLDATREAEKAERERKAELERIAKEAEDKQREAERKELEELRAEKAKLLAEQQKEREEALEKAREEARKELRAKLQPDYDKLNNWRMEAEKAVKSLPILMFNSEDVFQIYESERLVLLRSIPEIQPNF